MKILIAGAHFTPAVATIVQLKKYPGVSVIYVGRNRTQEGDASSSQESQILPKLGIKFIPITAGRFQREFTIYTIPSLLKIPIGILQSLYIILKERPDVILSFGGYVAVPSVVAGWLFSIPILIHEQTLVSGLSNKISSFFASKIAVSFPNSQYNREKVILTGNPIRDEILHPIKKLAAEYTGLFQYAKKSSLPVILVMGGNQGSHTINKNIEEILDSLLKISCVIHICGDNKFKDFEKLEKLTDEGYLVKKWIDKEIGGVLLKADFVICRAGANTLSELAYLNKPGLVIPFEPLFKDEQNKNAKYFENLGLVKILPQSRLSELSLLKSIKEMLKDLRKSRISIKKYTSADAAKRLALETILLSNA